MYRLKNYITTGLLCLAFFVLKAQQSKLYIKGFVVGVDTAAPIPLANIHNITSDTRYVTNRHGAFGIYILPTDTIEFSVLGYKTFTLIGKDYLNQGDVPIIVKLKRNYIKLKEVTISAQKRRQDSLARQAARRLKTDPLLNDFSTSMSIYNAAHGGMLSSILAGGNKKIREYERLMLLMEIYHEQAQVEEKYNIDLVMRTTQLNEIQARELMKFCEIPNYFVLNSNEYDIILAIKNCFKEWKSRKK